MSEKEPMTKRRKSRTLSAFASALRKLLDSQKDRLSHAHWADVLGVSPAAVSQWLSDKTVPSPEYLRDILSVVERDDGQPSRRALEEFQKLAVVPADQVSSLGYRFGESIADYLLGPLRKQFMRDLNRLAPETQERLLLKFSEACINEAGVLSVTSSRRKEQSSAGISVYESRRFAADLSSFSRNELAAAREQLACMTVPYDELGRLVSSSSPESHTVLSGEDVESLCLAAFAAAARTNNRTPVHIYRILLSARAVDSSSVTLPMITQIMNALCFLSPKWEIWARDLVHDESYKSYDAGDSSSLQGTLCAVRSLEVRYAYAE
jgi:transcriptional regulator with XRE-family HTH domain